MFKLTEEQIEYIIEYYGGSKLSIANIERELNSIGVVEDEDDYFEIICAVMFQKETLKEELERCTTKEAAQRIYITNQKIVVAELNRRYNNFEFERPDKQQKMKSLG